MVVMYSPSLYQDVMCIRNQKYCYPVLLEARNKLLDAFKIIIYAILIPVSGV
jgi:hypothetical protein